MRYQSGRALASALGVSPSRMTEYTRRADWPVTCKPPWTDSDLAKVKKWRGWLQEDRSGRAPQLRDSDLNDDKFVPNTKQRAEVLLKIHRARKTKAEADLAEGKVVERELLNLGMIAIARMFVQAGDDSFERLPHQLQGDPIANEAICRNAWHELRERIMAQGQVELSRVDDEIHDRLTQRRRARGRQGVN